MSISPCNPNILPRKQVMGMLKVINERLLGRECEARGVISFQANPVFIVVIFTPFQVIAVGSPSIAESDLRTMTTEPKYAVRVNDLQSPAEAEKVSKIICNGK